MGQPTPPGDMPLFDGLGSEWNDIVGALPEDKRAELAPRIKERISAYEPLKSYEDFHRSGITPDHISTALGVFSLIENKPREIYDAIGQHLGLTPQEAKAAVKTLEKEMEEDPRIQTMQQQIDTLAQIALAQRQHTTQEQQLAEQEAALEKEMSSLKSKYGDFDEEEIIMRMIHKDMSAEQAFQEYANKISELRKTRPSPMVIGGGGVVPQRKLDVTQLDNMGTKNLVAQMMQHAMLEQKKP